MRIHLRPHTPPEWRAAGIRLGVIIFAAIMWATLGVERPPPEYFELAPAPPAETTPALTEWVAANGWAE